MFSLRLCGWLVNCAFLKSLRGVIRDFFLSSCHHVRSFVWVWINWMMRPIDGGSHFRMRIFPGVISIWFLVFNVCAPGCSRNNSGLSPYQRVQEKFFEFRQITQNVGLWPSEIPWQFLVTLPSISWKTWLIHSSLILGTYVFRDWPFLECSSYACLLTTANFFLFLNIAFFWIVNVQRQKAEFLSSF